VEEALVEMYLAGVSVRRVEDITQALWGTRVSASTVSDLNQKIYRQIEEWRQQPLVSGTTKRGDPYLRMLLIHGARSVVYRSPHKTDSRSQWVAEKQRRLGTSKACVAVANKNARIIWALLAHDEPYRRTA